MNRLAREKSPYLLQHKDNPVDWYPWGPEAFAKAKLEDKPILLSIGYSTCHWCHVMERESFEDHDVARVMNERFVCVKLDREERPDVDRIYMTAVQAITGRGGWPLNVFLTPDLKPFYGGTYFPPRPSHGQPGWIGLLGHIAELWRARRADVAADAERLTEALTAYADAQGERAAPQAEALDRAFEGLRLSFDPENGGFGGAPKFPMPVNLAFLLRYWARTGKEEALGMAASTLKAMARGGIYDQLGGGFSRYSTDPYWRIPHFEKMLYDNAQLASALVEAWQARPDAELERALRGTLGYLLRDLRGPEGGFFSAEDADSQGPDGRKSEGAFYLWSEREIKDALGPRAAAFMERYGVRPEGNAPTDPHGEFEGKNALYDAEPGEPDVFEEDRRVLFELRLKRPRPSLDDKVLASWNGLAIAAFAKAARALGEPSYADAARSAARFLREKLYDEASGTLYHRWREGERAVEGLADDYAFLAAGLIDLYEATLEREWLLWAESLLDGLEARFAAPAGGYYQAASGSKDLLVRVVDDSDNVEPCGSSAAALSQLRLSRMLDRADLRERAQRTLERFGALLADRPGSLGAMLCAVDLALGEPSEVVLAGDRSLPAFRALERAAGRAFRPRQVLLGPGLEDRQPALAAMTAAGGPPRAYVCSGYACERPVSDAAELSERLSR